MHKDIDILDNVSEVLVFWGEKEKQPQKQQQEEVH